MADIKIIVDSSDVATATNRVDKLGNSGKVAKKGMDKATRGMNQFGAVAKNGGKKMNTFNMQLQQGGYQLQDFVVQLQSGTSFFTAFGQQGSQFAGVFGPKGAVIGAVIAIGSAVGGLLVNSLMGASKEVDNLTESLAKYKSLSDKIADSKSLSKEFGNLAVEARTVLDALKAIEGINLKKQFAELGGIGKVIETTSKQVSMGGFMNLVPTFKEITHLSAKTLTSAQDFLGLTEGTVAEMAVYANEYARALMAVQSAGTLEAQAEAAGKLSKFLKEHVELRGEDTENLEQITKLQEVLLGLMKATAVASSLEEFGGEGPDLDAIAKARKEIEEKARQARIKNGEAYFRNEKAIQEAIHQVWVRDNAEKNKKRLDDIEAEKKSRMDAGKAYFKQEQDDAAAILSQRIKNILAELKAKKDAEVAAMAIRRSSGEAYAEREQGLENDIHQAIIDRIMAEHKAKVKANQDAVDLRRAAGMAYAEQEQGLENDIHMMRVDNILNESALREATISAARAKFNVGSDKFGEASEDVLSQRIAELRDAFADLKKTSKPKKTEAEKIADTIAAFKKQLDLEERLLRKTDARRKVLQALGEEIVDKNPKIVSDMEAQIVATQKVIDLEKQRQSIIDSVTGSVENGMMAMVDGTLSVKEAFKSMASEIIKDLYRVLVVQKIVAAAKFAMGFADGGVISDGNKITAYANGGVVGTPTTFAMSGGKTGLMGEAGPEAIMPLKRGSNGKLGVQMEGGNGGDNVVIHQNFNFQANGDDTVKKLIAQAAPKIMSMTKTSLLDDRRRGGSTKAAFG